MAFVDGVISFLDTFVYIIKWFWWLIIVLWLVILKVIHKKYPVEAVIIEKRGENLIKTNDRAGRYFDDATGMTGYKLMKCKDKMPVPNFEWVLHNNIVHTSFFERIINFLRGNAGTIFFFKYGSKQYKPCGVGMDEKYNSELKEIKDEDGKPILVNIYEPIDPRDKLGALDFEVVDWDNMNFMIQEQRVSQERRKKKTEMLYQFIVPAMILGATVVIIIVMIKYGYNYALEIKGSDQIRPQGNPTPDIPIIKDIIPG